MAIPLSLKNIVWKTVRGLGLGGLVLQYYPNSFLRNAGWFRSFREWQSVDAAGRPLPWLTYAFLHFFEPRLNPDFRMFEYGCGFSTMWYAARVKNIVAVENNAFWAEKVTTQLPSHGKVVLREDPDAYVNEVRNHPKFDIIVIDGVFRERCWEPALESLLPEGVIVWDNSDREDFDTGYQHLQAYGFRELPFYGLSPSDFVATRTSVLYRSANCLKI